MMHIWFTRKCSVRYNTQWRPAAAASHVYKAFMHHKALTQFRSKWNRIKQQWGMFTRIYQKWNRITATATAASHHITGIYSTTCNESPIFIFFELWRTMNSPRLYTTFEGASERRFTLSIPLFQRVTERPKKKKRNKKLTKKKFEKNTGLSLKAVKIIITMNCIQRTHRNYNCNMRWNCVCA